MKRFLFLIGVWAMLLLVSACQPALEKITPPMDEIAASDTATPGLFSISSSPTQTPTPTPTVPTQEPTVTNSVEITPDQTPGVVQWLDFHVEFANYTQVSLEFNLQQGTYYGEGETSGRAINAFRCSFKMPPSTELVCRGDPLLAGESMNFTLYDTANGTPIYRNRFSNVGSVPTPVGMVCEVEPQWNNQGHELGQGCFAISCYLNGVTYYGNNNTCEEPWPFDWDFYHPLAPLP